MPHHLLGPTGWCAFVVGLACAAQACSNDSSSGGGDGKAGGGGAGGDVASHEGGMAARSGGAGSSAAGSATATNGGSNNAGSAGNAGGAASNAEGGAGGSAGAGGSEAIQCHISWTGAATGEADCGYSGVCKKNFLSLNVYDPAPPLKGIQLIYSPNTDLMLGPFAAADHDMVNTFVPGVDAGVNYAPMYDANQHLTGGTSMSGTFTALNFSTDPVDVCSGTAHGSLDVVLPDAEGAKKLSLHAEF